MKEIRWQEIRVLIYRLFLIFFFYQIARLLFWWFNRDLVQIDDISYYLKLAYHGTAFDTTAILYVNSVFILLSLIPLIINTKQKYQKFLFGWYFITNALAYAMNFGDIIYYRFSQARLTSAVLDVAQNEDNLGKVLGYSLVQNPLVVVLFVMLIGLWIFLYNRVKIEEKLPQRKVPYFVFSILSIVVSAVLVVGGIRGDFKHSTRPINLVDANRHTLNPIHANVLLNSTFSFFRTIGTNNFKGGNFVSEDFINEKYQVASGKKSF